MQRFDFGADELPVDDPTFIAQLVRIEQQHLKPPPATILDIPDDVWRSGLPTDGQHLPHGLIDNYRRISLEYRLLPKRAHKVEVPACHGCRIVVPEHVRQVDTLVLEIPHHVLLRWLM